MTEQEYKKVEFYLYNYHKINYLIKIRETDLIDSINVSNNAWIKSIKDTSNTMEEQAIKIIDDNLIKEYQEWKKLIDNILQELRKYDKTKLKVVEYKFFGNIPEDVIADELFVSKTTVRTYINDIYFEVGILATFNNLITKSMFSS